MATQKVNYTEEQTQKIVAQYQAGTDVEAIAEEIGKTVRSVRSKLVREGVYVAPEKPAAKPKDDGPTKKELLRELEEKVPYSVDGLTGATKPAIQAIIDHVDALTVQLEG